MNKVTLKQMLDELSNCILNNKSVPKFLWKRNDPDYIEITEVDLLRDRFKTIDDDFCCYNWSNDIEIYREDIKETNK